MQDWLDRAGIDKSQTVTIGTDPIEHLLKELMQIPGAFEGEPEALPELEAEVVYDAELVDADEDDPLGDAFADAQRVVNPEPEPEPEPSTDAVANSRMPAWMRKSVGNT